MSALFWTIRITSERYLIGIPPSMFCNANLKFLGHFQYNLSLIVLFFFFFFTHFNKESTDNKNKSL